MAIHRRVHLLLILAAQVILIQFMLVALGVIIVLIGIKRFILLFYTLDFEVSYTMLKVQVALCGSPRQT